MPGRCVRCREGFTLPASAWMSAMMASAKPGCGAELTCCGAAAGGGGADALAGPNALCVEGET